MDDEIKGKYWKLSGFASGIEAFLWLVLVVALIGSVVIGFTVKTEDSYGHSQPNFVLAAASAICSAIAIVPLIAVMRAIHVWSLDKSDGYRPQNAGLSPSSGSSSAASSWSGSALGMGRQGFQFPVKGDASKPESGATSESVGPDSVWKISDDPDDPKIVV